jgi:RNA polymerase sigma-70 factor (ECF subfamily)
MDRQREERFAALYESSRARLLAYALRRTTSSEDAADIVAETFTIAWRRLDEIPDGDLSMLWLFVAARLVIANHARRMQRRTQLVQRIGAHLATGAQASSLSSELDALDASRAFGRLSGEDQELLMLAGWEGLDSAGLGYVLGCSPTAARIRLHRARARLKAELTGRPGPTQQPLRIQPSRRGVTLVTETPEEI